MRIGLLTLDKGGGIASLNVAAEQILGYRAREVRGKPCEEIFTGLTDLLTDLRGQRPDNKREIQFKSSARHKNGREVSLVITPHATPDGDHRSADNGVILVFQRAQELETMENRLQHLDRLQALDHFAAGIVHEIRNPLAGISTNAQHILERIKPSDPFHEEMQDILADEKDIEGIVSQVLDFAHPSKPQVQEGLIEDIVNEVLRFSKMPLRRQGIQLRTNLKKSAATVRVDVSQMKQVFFNIVRNACDAMPEGGELRVSTSQPSGEDRCVRVEVEDTGRGIAKEHLERIFDPFFSMNREGTGLGLAISRKIVESHGGRIEVKSRPGKGTKFGVVLPAV